jgi:hypothetical protein
VGLRGLSIQTTETRRFPK